MSLYDSNDPKIGIDVKLLAEAVPILLPLLEIDPRGGFFCQLDMARAVNEALTVTRLHAELVEHAAEQNKSADEIRMLVAYKIRVMLAHVRIKHDSWTAAAKPSPLDVLYGVMSKPKNDTHTDVRTQRRARRLATRPCPFVNFREEEEQPSNEESDEEAAATVVSRYYCGKKRTATMLMSDGQQINADTYTEGTDGFIRADWLHDMSMLMLEVPNNFLDKDANRIMAFEQPPPSKRLRRPAAAKRPASEVGEENADAGGEEEGSGRENAEEEPEKDDIGDDDAAANVGDDDEA